MKVAEFFAEILFKTNPLPLKSLIKNIGELSARTVLATVGLDQIYLKLKDITEQSIATAMTLNLFGKSTNLPIENAQRFANAVEKLGGNAQEAMSDLAQLQMRLLKLKMLGTPDQGISQSLYWLNNKGNAGISSLGTDPIEFIDKARHGFQRLNKDVQTVMLSQLGLSQSSALYLRMTDSQWEAQKKLMSSNDEQIRKITEMGGAWRGLGQVTKQMGMNLTEDLTPYLEKLAVVLTDVLTLVEKSEFSRLPTLLREASIFADALWIGIEKIAEGMFKIHDKFSIALPSMAGVTGAGASMTQQNTITIAVHGSASGPAGIAQQIAREIEQVLKKTAYQDGGKRL